MGKKFAKNSTNNFLDLYFCDFINRKFEINKKYEIFLPLINFSPAESAENYTDYIYDTDTKIEKYIEEYNYQSKIDSNGLKYILMNCYKSTIFGKELLTLLVDDNDLFYEFEISGISTIWVVYNTPVIGKDYIKLKKQYF